MCVRNTTPWSRLVVKDDINIAWKERRGALLGLLLGLYFDKNLNDININWFFLESMSNILQNKLKKYWKEEYQKILEKHFLNFFLNFYKDDELL